MPAEEWHSPPKQLLGQVATKGSSMQGSAGEAGCWPQNLATLGMGARGMQGCSPGRLSSCLQILSVTCWGLAGQSMACARMNDLSNYEAHKGKLVVALLFTITPFRGHCGSAAQQAKTCSSPDDAHQTQDNRNCDLTLGKAAVLPRHHHFLSEKLDLSLSLFRVVISLQHSSSHIKANQLLQRFQR